MTITNALDELILNTPEWYKPYRISKANAKKLLSSFKTNGSHVAEIKNILTKAGYKLNEGWSKVNPDIEAGTVAPKTGIIYDGMNTPAAPIAAAQVSPESEILLLKQAENPLGDPDKS